MTNYITYQKKTVPDNINVIFKKGKSNEKNHKSKKSTFFQ